MGYQEALEAAGAEVILFQEFGSYQGTWLAKVNYHGETGWIEGSYGSCSGCDAFEAEFDWNDKDKPDYQKRLAEFGESYLSSLIPGFQMLVDYKNKSEKAYAWSDDKEIYDFLKKHEDTTSSEGKE